MIPKTFKEIWPGYPQTNLYDKYNLPFSYDLAVNLEDSKERTYKNPRHKPTMIVIDGQSGTGKTSLAVLVASYLQGSPIDLDNQIGQGADNFVKCVEWAIQNGKKIVIYDEAGDFNKKATLTKANAAINRVFETYRTFGIIIIICLPNIGVLDNGPFDNGTARILINLFEGRPNYTAFRVYSLAGMLWIRHHMSQMARKYPIKQRAYARVTPNIYGYVKKLPAWLQNKIDLTSTAGKKVELAKAFKKIKEAEV